MTNQPNSNDRFLFLPMVMRVVSKTIEMSNSGAPIHRACLYADGERFNVEWMEPIGSNLIEPNALVRIEHKGLKTTFNNHYVQIKGLRLVDEADEDINIFSTALPEWFDDRELIERSSFSYRELDAKNRKLLNAIFLDGEFFKRFCEGPSSTQHHHSHRNGNLIHTIEVVEFVYENIVCYPTADYQLAMMFAWLHDIGKADEYTESNALDKEYKLTPDGYLHGHQLNGLFKTVQAQARFCPEYPKATFNNLRHLLEVRMGNDPLNLRAAQLQEHTLVECADKTSATANIYLTSHKPGLSYGIAPPGPNGKRVNFRYEV